MDVFGHAVAIIMASEGGYSADPGDPGNWTGGTVGVGECRGTNHGISAAAYPTLDIAALTTDAAAAIYRRDYWDRLSCDLMVPPLALLVFDAGVNNGIARSAEWLQGAVGAMPDGVIGPVTLRTAREAAQLRGWPDVCAETLARRIDFMAGLPTWPTFGPGWSRRLAHLPWQAMSLGS